jgi:ribose transport system permease protein
MIPVKLIQETSKKFKRTQSIRSILQHNAIIVSFVLLFIILSLAAPAFFSTRNFFNVSDQSAQIGIITCGMTLVIIGGGFDLSSGAIYAITGVTASILANQFGTVVGVIAGLTLGFVIGLINGIIISKLHINSFIATLATSFIITGAGLVFVSGRIIMVNAPYFDLLGQGKFLGVKVSVYLWLAIIAVSWFILSRTTLGRYIFAVGGNPIASRLSGVRIDFVRTLSYGISGLCDGIAGVIAASRISTGLMDVGAGLTLEAIAAVVIGGTSIFGGEGAIWRSILGVLLLQLILNGFNILTIAPFYQQIFQGLIILIAVTIDALPRRET